MDKYADWEAIERADALAEMRERARPLPGIPTWVEFQERFSASIPPPAQLVRIYELVLAAAITEQLRSER